MIKSKQVNLEVLVKENKFVKGNGYFVEFAHLEIFRNSKLSGLSLSSHTRLF